MKIQGINTVSFKAHYVYVNIGTKASKNDIGVDVMTEEGKNIANLQAPIFEKAEKGTQDTHENIACRIHQCLSDNKKAIKKADPSNEAFFFIYYPGVKCDKGFETTAFNDKNTESPDSKEVIEPSKIVSRLNHKGIHPERIYHVAKAEACTSGNSGNNPTNDEYRSDNYGGLRIGGDGARKITPPDYSQYEELGDGTVIGYYGDGLTKKYEKKPDGIIIGYDKEGNKRSEKLPNGTKYRYNKEGIKISEEKADGELTIYADDGIEVIYRRTSKGEIYKSEKYRPQRYVLPDGTIEERNPKGVLIYQETPDGKVVQRDYNGYLIGSIYSLTGAP